MANHHLEVIKILWSAADDPRKFHCLFNRAMKKMKDFLEDFATKAAPLSSPPLDPQFIILMENFGTVIDTISIFYDCFDCEKRSETLKDERNAGRMHFFRFERNDPRPPLDTLASWRLYEAQYPRTVPSDTKDNYIFPPCAETPGFEPAQDLVFTPPFAEDFYSNSFDWSYPDRSGVNYYYWPEDEMRLE